MTTQSHLDTHIGHGIPYKTREALQAPWRGRWNAICAWEQAQNPGGVPTPLRAALAAIATANPEPVQARAVNTTRYGREMRDGE